MPLTRNGLTLDGVTFGGNALSAVQYNGAEVWSAGPSYPPYLTFSSASAFTLDSMAVLMVDPVHWDGIIEYSTDAETWTTWDGTTVNSASDNGTYKLYLRGSGNTVISGGKDSGFVITGSGVSCDGDIRTLLDYADPENTTMGESCFAYLFADNMNALVKAPDLPETTLSKSCYMNMFANCTGITQAPDLPALTMAQTCYANMFIGCTALTATPKLPATTLAISCYVAMFRNCTALATIPALPATDIPMSAYNNLFNGCTLVKISETQTGEYQTPYRIPAEGTGTMPTNAVTGMLSNTGGTFTSPPAVNTPYYTSNTIVG